MRKNHFLVELSRLPWWVSGILAVAVFVAVRWVGPALADSKPILVPLASAFANNALWIACIFLIPIPFSLATAFRRRRLAATQPRLDAINALPWQDFELLVAEVYRQRGYSVVERGGSSADGGVDLELRTKQKKVVVQCKRWKTQVVGVDRVRELFGAMMGERASAAIMVSSGRYTPDAIEFARDKPIELIDGSELAKMLEGVQRGKAPKQVTDDAPTKVEPKLVSRADEVVIGPKSRESVSCPKCGSTMVRRIAKQGSRAGNAFWGCSRFPACRGTLSAE
jgi:restriction system protein